MIKRAESGDRNDYVALAKAFYSSEAVLHSIPEANIENTFDGIIDGNPFAELFMLVDDGRNIGYFLTAKSYSQEAGGMVGWFEEIYIMPEYRGKGLGQTALMYMEGKFFEEGYARVRLEVEPENERAVKLYKDLRFRELKYQQYYKEFIRK